MLPILPLARRAVLAVVLCVALLGLAGCGDCCDDGDDVYGGTLQVLNDPQSISVLETVGVSVAGGPVELFDVFLMPGEDAFIDLYPDTYDVDLWWDDLTMETVFDVPIWDDEVTQVIAFH